MCMCIEWGEAESPGLSAIGKEIISGKASFLDELRSVIASEDLFLRLQIKDKSILHKTIQKF